MKSPTVQNSPSGRILAVHGFTGEPYDFAPLYESGVLPVDWRFVTLPGHHREWRPPAGPNDVSGWHRFCDQISQIVQEAQQDGLPLVGLAYSMGARLLLRAQLAMHWDFATLWLVGVSAGIESSADRVQRLESDQNWATRLREQGMEPFLDAWMQQPLLVSQREGPLEWVAPRMERKRLLEPEALARALLDFSNGRLDPVWQKLGELQVPVHLIAGAQDLKFQQLHARMQQLLPKAWCHVLPEVGHAPHVEDPERFLKLLVRLLEMLD